MAAFSFCAVESDVVGSDVEMMLGSDRGRRLKLGEGGDRRHMFSVTCITQGQIWYEGGHVSYHDD